MTDIAPYETPVQLTPHNPDQLDRAALELLKKTVAEGASDLEFELFVRLVHRTGLDPFAKQIYCIKRAGKMTIQTGIDGYRLVAARTGQLAGIDDPVFDEEDQEHPNRATVTVWRMVAGNRVPFTATARWREYAQYYGEKLADMWRKMPYTMLGKCAESLALRKGFPQELSGVYTEEEMTQADDAPAPQTRPAAVNRQAQVNAQARQVARPVQHAVPLTSEETGPDAMTPAQRKMLETLLEQTNRTDALDGLTRQAASKLISDLKQEIEFAKAGQPQAAAPAVSTATAKPAANGGSGNRRYDPDTPASDWGRPS